LRESVNISILFDTNVTKT